MKKKIYYRVFDRTQKIIRSLFVIVASYHLYRVLFYEENYLPDIILITLIFVFLVYALYFPIMESVYGKLFIEFSDEVLLFKDKYFKDEQQIFLDNINEISFKATKITLEMKNNFECIEIRFPFRLSDEIWSRFKKTSIKEKIMEIKNS